MRRVWKKLFGCVLSVGLLFAGLTTGYGAENEAEYLDAGGSAIASGSFSDMWNQAISNKSGTVRLLSDISADGSLGSGDGFAYGYAMVPRDASVGLDLNGYTLSRGLTEPKSNGCVVYVATNGSLMISNGTLSGGNTTGSGGGLQVADGGQAVLSNLMITGNTASRGGGLFVGGSKAEVSAVNCTIEQNTATVGSDVFVQSGQYGPGVLAIGGKIVISDLYLDARYQYQSLLSKVEPLSADSSVSVTSGSRIGLITRTGFDSSEVGCFHSFLHDFSLVNGCVSMAWYDEDKHPTDHTIGQKDVVLIYSDGSELYGTFADVWNAATIAQTGTVRLLTDCTAEKPFPEAVYTSFGNGVGFSGGKQMTVRFGTNLVLDLNGFTLNRAMNTDGFEPDLGGSLFQIFPGGSLTILSGTLSGGKAEKGGAVYNMGGTLTLDGVTITDCSGVGGGVYAGADSTTVLEKDVVMSQNKSGSERCNLYVANGASVVFHGDGDTASNIGLTSDVENQSSVVTLSGLDGSVFFSDKASYMVVTTDHIVSLSGTSGDVCYKASSGETFFGTFREMWTKAASDSGAGTLVLLTDVDVTGESKFVWNSGHACTLDFNGHVLSGTGTSGSYMFELSGSGVFTMTNGRRAHVTRQSINDMTVPNPSPLSWKESVYEEWAEGDTLVNYMVTLDTDGYGGIEATGYDRLVRVVGAGNLAVSGGRYTNTGGFLHQESVDSSVSIMSGYFYGDGTDSAPQLNGGMFYVRYAKAFSMSHATVVNSSGKQGGVFRFRESPSNGSAITILDCVFSGNHGEYNGGVFYTDDACNSVVLKNNVFTDNTSKERGGVGFLNCKSLVSSDNVYAYNSAQVGGVMNFYRKADGKYEFTNDRFEYNNGRLGGVLGNEANTSPTCVVTGCSFENNRATEYGGAIYAKSQNRSMVCRITDTTITRNEAVMSGAGVYDANADVSVGGNTTIDGNRLSGGRSCNVWMSGATYLTCSSKLTGGKIGIRLDDSITDSEVLVMKCTPEDSDAVNAMNLNVISNAGHLTGLHGRDLYFVISAGEVEDVDFDGVLVQYTVRMQRFGFTSSAKARLPLIDTSGAKLPVNNGDTTDTSLPTRQLYIMDDGSLAYLIEPTEVYRPRTYAPAEVTDVPTINRFDELDDSFYEPGEIWIAHHDSVKTGNITRSDWTVYPYSENLVFTTDPDESGAVYVSEGSIIRFVYRPVVDEYSVDAEFYDYDLTDGHIYATADDAKNQRNPLPVSDLDARLSAQQNTYLHTTKAGINSVENYGTGNKAGAHLAFGNANTANGWFTEQMVDSTGGLPAGTKLNINQVNRQSFKLCTYGMTKNLDDNGFITYQDDVLVQNLFGEGDAIGKTAYYDYDLVFRKTGDLYELSRVNGAAPYAQNLLAFNNPVFNGKPYSTIWTNNFWPMDSAASFNTEGHDAKFGTSASQSYIRTQDGGSMPVSDDGQFHNAYFGMHTQVSFTLQEDYIGPLEYYFFGDDDLWVFLDGQLICDIGGVHISVGEYVNLWDYLKDARSVGSHTLDIYYTERGASGSTCFMSFILPHPLDAASTEEQFGTMSFVKSNYEGDMLSGAEFTLYRDEACTKKSAQAVSGADGQVVFQTLKYGTYYLKETKAPDGYAADGRTFTCVVTAEGTSITAPDGTIFSGTFYNQHKTGVKPDDLPSTGGFGTMRFVFMCSFFAVLGVGCTAFGRGRKGKLFGLSLLLCVGMIFGYGGVSMADEPNDTGDVSVTVAYDGLREQHSGELQSVLARTSATVSLYSVGVYDSGKPVSVHPELQAFVDVWPSVTAADTSQALTVAKQVCKAPVLTASLSDAGAKASMPVGLYYMTVSDAKGRAGVYTFEDCFVEVTGDAVTDVYLKPAYAANEKPSESETFPDNAAPPGTESRPADSNDASVKTDVGTGVDSDSVFLLITAVGLFAISLGLSLWLHHRNKS